MNEYMKFKYKDMTEDEKLQALKENQTRKMFMSVSGIGYVCMPDAITSFTGEYAFLDLNYPFPFTYQGKKYTSITDALDKLCNEAKVEMLEYSLALEEKKCEKAKITPFDEWNLNFDLLLGDMLKTKFTENEEMKEKLLATGDRDIVYDGDNFWGVCDGCGLNLFGITVNNIRRDLRKTEG